MVSCICESRRRGDNPCRRLFLWLPCRPENTPRPEAGKSPGSGPAEGQAPTTDQGAFFMRRKSRCQCNSGAPHHETKRAAAGLRRPSLCSVPSRERELLERIPALFTVPDGNQNISIGLGPSLDIPSPLAWSFAIEECVGVDKIVIITFRVQNMQMNTFVFIPPT